MKLIIDVLQVKMNDIIEHRDGSEEKVNDVFDRRENGYTGSYPVLINQHSYTLNGEFDADFETHSLDIIAIHRTETDFCGEPGELDLWYTISAYREEMKNHVHNPEDFKESCKEPENPCAQIIYEKPFPKPSRMIDLFVQGVEFVKDCDGYIWRVKDERPEAYYPKIGRWSKTAPCEELFQPASIAENPEKPKRFVYQWVYKHEKGTYHHVTILKFETEEQVRESLHDHEGLGGSIVYLEKIEHSREEV